MLGVEVAGASRRMVGRYAMFDRIASGGMATVHLGRLLGPAGFSRVVAIKKLNEEFEEAPEAIAAFVDEARLAARVRHPNVVQTLDVLLLDREVFLVLEYVQGEALHRLLKRSLEKSQPVPMAIAAAIMAGVLEGLHAAHEAKNEHGEALGIVHRDVSPQNVIVGEDGIARVLDFGIAKADGRLQTTRPGGLKGKQGYIAPESLVGQPITRAADIFAASIVLWEMLAMRRLFGSGDARAMIKAVLESEIARPSKYNSWVSPQLDEVVLQGLSRDPRARFESARAMAIALERLVVAAPARDVAEWVRTLAEPELEERARLVAEVERVATDSGPAEMFESISTPRHALSDDADRTRGEESLLDVRAPAARPKKTNRAMWASLALLVFLSAAIAIAGSRLRDDVSQQPVAAPVTKIEPEPAVAPDPPVEEEAEEQRPLPKRKRRARQIEAAATRATSPATAETPVVREEAPNKCDPPYWIDKEGIRHLIPECE